RTRVRRSPHAGPMCPRTRAQPTSNVSWARCAVPASSRRLRPPRPDVHPEAPWRGCHGVRLHGAELDLGTACGTPLADASVETIAGLSRPLPDTAPLWEASASIGGMTVAQRAWRRDDGSLVVHTDAGAAVEAARPEVAAQLVATYALPLLVQHTASLVLHASAAVRPGAGAVLVCGR